MVSRCMYVCLSVCQSVLGSSKGENSSSCVCVCAPLNIRVPPTKSIESLAPTTEGRAHRPPDTTHLHDPRRKRTTAATALAAAAVAAAAAAARAITQCAHTHTRVRPVHHTPPFSLPTTHPNHHAAAPFHPVSSARRKHTQAPAADPPSVARLATYVTPSSSTSSSPVITTTTSRVTSGARLQDHRVAKLPQPLSSGGLSASSDSMCDSSCLLMCETVWDYILWQKTTHGKSTLPSSSLLPSTHPLGSTFKPSLP